MGYVVRRWKPFLTQVEVVLWLEVYYCNLNLFYMNTAKTTCLTEKHLKMTFVADRIIGNNSNWDIVTPMFLYVSQHRPYTHQYNTVEKSYIG